MSSLDYRDVAAIDLNSWSSARLLTCKYALRASVNIHVSVPCAPTPPALSNPESIIVTSNTIHLLLNVLRAPNNTLTTRNISMAQGSLADEGMQNPAQYIQFNTSSL